MLGFIMGGQWWRPPPSTRVCAATSDQIDHRSLEEQQESARQNFTGSHSLDQMQESARRNLNDHRSPEEMRAWISTSMELHWTKFPIVCMTLHVHVHAWARVSRVGNQGTFARLSDTPRATVHRRRSPPRRTFTHTYRDNLSTH
jgi:hypothetical protein